MFKQKCDNFRSWKLPETLVIVNNQTIFLADNSTACSNFIRFPDFFFNENVLHALTVHTRHGECFANTLQNLVFGIIRLMFTLEFFFTNLF